MPTSTAQASLRSAFGDVHPCERRRRTRTEGSPRRQSRALKILAVATAVATFRVIHARASEGGHLKQSFSGPPVASAQDSRGRRCGGDLSRDPRQSERRRASEAKLQRPASRERSSHVASAQTRRHLSPPRFIRGEAGQSEQVAKQVASAQTTYSRPNRFAMNASYDTSSIFTKPFCGT